MQKIGLVMIVRDEAKVIEDCLYSVLPYIDHYTIVDTGSTDDTKEIIRKFFEINFRPGVLISSPWVDFAHNRTEVLAFARQSGADYSLMIDADDVLEVPNGFVMPTLSKDAYNLQIRHVTIEFPRVQLFKNSSPWYYRGVLHEFPECAKPNPTIGHVSMTMQTTRGGSRSQDPNKYLKDAVVLQKALQKEADSPTPDALMCQRYTFYLAQSLRDAGETEAALRVYEERSNMGGYTDEVYYSLYQCQILADALNLGRLVVEGYYRRADALRLGRAEHARHYAFFLRERMSEFEEAVTVLKPWVGVRMPLGSLFGEPWVYHFGILDELSVSLFWAGRPAEALMHILNILRDTDKMPQDTLHRIGENAKQCYIRVGS